MHCTVCDTNKAAEGCENLITRIVYEVILRARFTIVSSKIIMHAVYVYRRVRTRTRTRFTYAARTCIPRISTDVITVTIFLCYKE